MIMYGLYALVSPASFLGILKVFTVDIFHLLCYVYRGAFCSFAHCYCAAAALILISLLSFAY